MSVGEGEDNRREITTVMHNFAALLLAPETTAASSSSFSQSAVPHIYFDLCSENEEMKQCLEVPT